MANMEHLRESEEAVLFARSLWSILLDGGHALIGLRDALESMVARLRRPGNVLILVFSAQIGSFIALTERSGGVEGFVQWIVKRGYVRTSRGARLLASPVGLGLFLESNLRCLISGAVARPLFDLSPAMLDHEEAEEQSKRGCRP